ncbi:MAG TPA: transglutaminase-like domain-containing protein [Pyrinomonadaceae bacterium]|nr:transglutaminase-like domain-containing protein [Pyrinomonadaceae bacterium]
MTPADKLLAAEARGSFAREVARPGGEIDLARAALFAGQEEEPRACDVGRCLALLEEMGAAARDRTGASAAPVEALNEYLFGELGFAGNESDYYDPRNSMLHRVLGRRTGIPITLSLVYMEVGRRAGLAVEGVGLPGHFIVRARAGGQEPVLVDPFNGRIVDREECQRRVDFIYGGEMTLSDEHLRPLGARPILVRLLNNLKSIYTQAQLFRRALSVVERILLVTPNDLGERRDRGLLLAQVGRLPEAIDEIQSYLNLATHAPDADEVREQLKKLRTRHSMLN